MRLASSLLAMMILCIAPAYIQPAFAQRPSEYRIKAAFLYNFVLFTEWPPSIHSPLTLCVYGGDPFAGEIDALQGKPVGERLIQVRRTLLDGPVEECQVVFIAASAISRLPSVLDALRGHAALIVADSPGAARRGAALNMSVVESKVAFEANLAAARDAGVNLSSQLLRLAAVVIQ